MLRGVTAYVRCLRLADQKGLGIKQNDIEAIRWLTKAANQGHLDAKKYFTNLE
jgi:TPR repeat protein